MNRPRLVGLVLVSLAGLIVAGCGKSSSNPSTADTKGTEGSAKADSPASKGDQVVTTADLTKNIAKRPSLEGRWILLFYQRMTGAEVPAALVEVTKNKEGNYRVKVPQYGKSLTNPTTKLAQATPNSIHLVIDMAVQSMVPGQAPVRQNKAADVVVDFRDGYARGNAEFSPLDVFPVAMIPTDREIIQDVQPSLLPETAELTPDKEAKPEQIAAKTTAFVQAHPDSPLTVEIYPYLFKTAAERKIDAAGLKAEIEKYMAAASRWGARQALKARIDVAAALVGTNFQPAVAIQLLNETIAQLNEETIPIWKTDLEALRDTAIANQALATLLRGSLKEKEEAAELLRKRSKVQPYDPIISIQLARYDEAKGNKQLALEEFSRLAVLPLFDEVMADLAKRQKAKWPSPRETAEALWKETHGGKTDGFAKYLDDLYAREMPKFTDAPVQPRPADPDNRIVVCELFTGTSCGFCVGADVAFAHLIKTYKPTELIALQYHEHIPRPDPLSNEDSEARFKFYFPEKGGTPTFTISGFAVQRGGMLHQADEVYRSLRPMVDKLLSRKTSVRIQLTAEPKGSVVAVSAKAEGSFPPNEPIHLRLVLAEDHIHLRAPNGIREHHMVVRAMPGGPHGVELADGKLAYKGNVDLKTIRKQLDDYLIALEEQQKTKFSSKPLDLAHLHLVAFVQNDQTREIYQAALVPFPTASPAAAQADRKESFRQQSVPARNDQSSKVAVKVAPGAKASR